MSLFNEKTRIKDDTRGEVVPPLDSGGLTGENVKDEVGGSLTKDNETNVKRIVGTRRVC